MSNFISEDGAGYTWEQNYERSWEEDGIMDTDNLRNLVKEIELRRIRQRLRKPVTNIQRGMMRHLYIVIDFSQSMDDNDLKPNRLFASLELLGEFVVQFFEQNPIAQIGILATKDGSCELISELSGNTAKHLTVLKEKTKISELSGGCSIENSLKYAWASLKNVPSHTSREILFVLGGLSSRDPSNIYETLKQLQNENITCSIVGLAASMHICKHIAEQTDGHYNVVMDNNHMSELLRTHVQPPPAPKTSKPALVKMAFPDYFINASPSPCACHSKITKDGYECPRCANKYCDLPCECVVCGLTLVSSTHIARSYHHLFPVQPFVESNPKSTAEIEISDDLKTKRLCYGCSDVLGSEGKESKSSSVSSVCDFCKNEYCLDCDLFIHDTLHDCPACSVRF